MVPCDPLSDEYQNRPASLAGYAHKKKWFPPAPGGKVDPGSRGLRVTAKEYDDGRQTDPARALAPF
ncbi:hypothetical protein SAMN05880558_101247 [Aeromonas sp. RU39B]|nr:hypothetical protein SAMN05880558_101247 [Aeromonas sp. RU39B]